MREPIAQSAQALSKWLFVYNHGFICENVAYALRRQYNRMQYWARHSNLPPKHFHVSDPINAAVFSAGMVATAMATMSSMPYSRILLCGTNNEPGPGSIEHAVRNFNRSKLIIIDDATLTQKDLDRARERLERIPIKTIEFPDLTAETKVHDDRFRSPHKKKSFATKKKKR